MSLGRTNYDIVNVAVAVVAGIARCIQYRKEMNFFREDRTFTFMNILNFFLQQVIHNKGITLYCKLIVLGPNFLVNVVLRHLGLEPYFLITEASKSRQKEV